jgi:SpoIIAA-like
MSTPLAPKTVGAPPTQSAAAIVEVVLTGHLTRAKLVQALTPAEAAIAAGSASVALLVDCSAMSGYDTEAREYFVAWNKRSGGRVRRLAVVTERTMWHLVVSGMALASGQLMKAFDGRAAAVLWLTAP